MSALEDIISAWSVAPQERRESALRLLRGELPKGEPYLTLRALSRQLGYGASTLRRWRIPAHTIGNAKRYRLGEVELYLNSEPYRRRVAALRAERSQTGGEQ